MYYVLSLCITSVTFIYLISLVTMLVSLVTMLVNQLYLLSLKIKIV